MEPRNRFQGMNSASICSLAGRYDNPFPTRCLAPIDFLKIPALSGRFDNPIPARFLTHIDCSKIPALYVFVFYTLRITRDCSEELYEGFCFTVLSVQYPMFNNGHLKIKYNTRPFCFFTFIFVPSFFYSFFLTIWLGQKLQFYTTGCTKNELFLLIFLTSLKVTV
jgi:hypothetical protein